MQGFEEYIYFFGIILSIFVFILTVNQKPSKEQSIVVLFAVCSFLIWIGYWMTTQVTSLEGLIFAKKITYLGTCPIYFSLLLFYVRYYRLQKVKKIVPIFAAITCFIVAMTLTIDKHTLYYQSISLGGTVNRPTLEVEYGMMHKVYVGLLIVYTILTIGITVHQMYMFQSYKKNWQNEMILLAISLIPTTCYFLEKVYKTDLALVPIGLLFSDVALIYLIAGNKITDINILAKEFIYDTIEDAIVVVDQNNCFRGANPKAIAMFPSLNELHNGAKVSELPEEIQGVLKKTMTNNKVLIEHENAIYRFNPKHVIRQDKDLGSVFWFKDVTREVENIHLLENYQENLEKEVKKKTKQLREMQVQMIHGFSAIVENKNAITGNHIQRTSGYVEIIARELMKEGKSKELLNKKYLTKLTLASPLHDIGKISIPDSILDKPAKLTEEEFEIIKTHTSNGEQIIGHILEKSEDSQYVAIAKEVAKYHHEKWNGLGYPEGLYNEEIPLSARIMSVADVFDALVSLRPYKKPYGIEEAFEIIESESGKHFDPVIVHAFLNARQEIEDLFLSLNEANKVGG